MKIKKKRFHIKKSNSRIKSKITFLIYHKLSEFSDNMSYRRFLVIGENERNPYD